jgi:hypothetical protein
MQAEVSRASGRKRGLMTMIEEGNRRERQDCQVASFRKDLEEDPTRKIIDFESGRLALEKNSLRDEQNLVRLVGRNQLPGRLPHDWLELSLAMVLLIGLLLALVGALIASWRF